MQSSLVIEPSLRAAQNFTNSFFAKMPLDTTKNEVKVEKILPSTSLKGNSTIVFNFPYKEYPYSYDISKCFVSAKLRLVMKDSNALPAKEAKVCGINNMLSSLFSHVKLSINDHPISETPEQYYYKSYLENLLTFNRDVKESGWMTSNGYHEDYPWVHTAAFPNSGATKRSAYFRENHKESGEFSEEGAHLIGRLLHDLHTCNKSLPPETKVSVELSRTSDSLFIQNYGADMTTYAVDLYELLLYVPVINLSGSVSNALKERWDKEPIAFPFRRFAVTKTTIPKTNDHTTHSLFGGYHPTRVYLGLVRAEAERGTQKSSPFEFFRRWEVDKTENVEFRFHSDSARLSCLQDELSQERQRVRNIESLLAAVLTSDQDIEEVDGASTSRKGKKPQPKSSQSDSFLNKLKSAAKNLLASDIDGQSSCGSLSSKRSTRSLNLADLDEDAPLANLRAKTLQVKSAPEKKWIWCTKLSLQFNSSDLDQFSSECSLENCMVDFVRTNATNQFNGTLWSNSISYEKYLNGYYLNGFDLTASHHGASTAFLVPAVLNGDLRVNVKFSEVIPPSLNLELVIFSEYAETLFLYSDGRIEKTHSK